MSTLTDSIDALKAAAIQEEATAQSAISTRDLLITDQKGQIAQLGSDKADLQAQVNADGKTISDLNAKLAALQPKYDAEVFPNSPTAVQDGFNKLPADRVGTIFIHNGTYKETPNIPHPCTLIGESLAGVIFDFGGKPFTLSIPKGSAIKTGFTAMNAVFGKSGQPLVLITDNTSVEALIVKQCDSVGLIVRGQGKSDGTGGNFIKLGTIFTGDCGEMGLGVSHTRNCTIDSWTCDGCCNTTSFNPTKWTISPGNQGGAGKYAYNDGLTFGKVVVKNTSYTGPWFDTGNVNCVMNNVSIIGCGSGGTYCSIMIEQNDGTSSELGAKGINGATVTINNGVVNGLGNTDVMIAESSGVAMNNLEYHKQLGFRQMSNRASKIHNVSILNCISYGSSYPAGGYTKSAADISAQKIVMDGTTYHGLPRTIGYWFGTQTTIAQLQSLGLEKNGKLVA